MSKKSFERDDRNFIILFFVLLVVGFFFRIKLSPYFTFELDLNIFRAWSYALNTHGMGKFYDSTLSDYMPGYMYVLLALNKIQAVFPELTYQVLYKLPANLADTFNALIIYWMLKDYTNRKTAVFSSVVYYFNIALIANSTFWGQIESVHLLPILLSITLCLKGYFSLPVILATISAMIKPQSYVLLPFIFLISAKSDFQKSEGDIPYKALIIKCVIGILLIGLTIALISMPFTWNKYYSDGFIYGIFKSFLFLKERFLFSYDRYQYTSINAFNFWALTIGMWVNDQLSFGITYQKWGTVLFVLLFLVIIIRYFYSEILKPLKSGSPDSDLSKYSSHNKHYLNSVFAVMLVFFVLFMFVTRAHERHLFTALALMSLIVFRSPLYMLSYLIVSIIYLLNLFYSYLYLYPFRGFSTATFTPYIDIIVIIEILILTFLFISFMKQNPVIDKSLNTLLQKIHDYLKTLVCNYKSLV